MTLASEGALEKKKQEMNSSKTGKKLVKISEKTKNMGQ